MSSALVLNKNWIPIRIAPLFGEKGALSMLWSGRAKAVDSDYSVYNFDDWAQLAVSKDEPFVTLAKSYIRIPDVLLLCKYKDIPNQKLSFSRANIYRRDGNKCQYCGKRPSPKELTIEHILPRSQGGVSSWTNCVLACLTCNHRKADRTPQEAGMKLLSVPVKPKWSPSFVMCGYKKVHNTPKTWQKFINDAYWNTELEA